MRAVKPSELKRYSIALKSQEGKLEDKEIN